MLKQIQGLHHVTSMAGNARANNAFFTDTLGLRRVKKTVNFDAPDVYHLYYGDEVGTPGTEVLTAMAIDSTGALYVGGQTTGSIGGQPNAGQFDGYLLKYKASGTLQWARTLATASSEVVTAVAVDSDDNVYVAGYTYGTFPGSTSAGSADGFVAKYGPTGTLAWLQQIGSSEIDQFTAIAVDPSGGVVVIGATEGGFGLTMNKGPIGTSDVIVIKLTADGNLMDKFEDNRKKDPNAQTTEADFKKWFQTFLQSTGSQMLPVPDRDVLNIDKGPVHLHYNPREDLSKRLGMLGSGNTDKLIPLLQQMGVDTTHIGGLDRFNGTSPSKHWGQSNPIDLPLPSWLHTDPVK